MSENERVVLSPAEAEAMLPEGEMIHTFRQAGYAIIGADWERSEIIEAFQIRKPELSGEQATAMKHGIVFFDDHGAVFVETVANNRLHTDAGDSAASSGIVNALSVLWLDGFAVTRPSAGKAAVGWIPCQQGEMMEIKIVEITDENRPQLLHIAISGYIGEKCRYCQHVYKSVDDIAARNVVYAGESQYACKACFDTANPANTACTGQEPA